MDGVELEKSTQKPGPDLRMERIRSRLFVALFILLAVLVIPASSRTQPTPPVCDSPATVVPCMTDWALENLDDLEYVSDTLTKRHLTDQDFAAGCHITWHALGQAAGTRYPIDKALDSWVYSCAGGFMHGVMSTAPRRGNLDKFGHEAGSVCAGYESRSRVAYLDCWHGIGHGYAHVLSFPESMYACHPVAPAQDEFEWCAWGASEMPNEAYQTDPVVRERFKNSLPQLCDGVLYGHRACYRMSLLMMHGSGWRYEDMLDYCQKQPSAHSKSCGYGLGQVVAARWLSGALGPEACLDDRTLSMTCAAGFGWHLARPFEWGAFDDSPDLRTRVERACSLFVSPHRRSCQDSFDELRRIELSPTEERSLMESWKP